MYTSLKVAMDSLKNAFNSFQTSLGNLKLVLNAKKKTKCMNFTQSRLSLHYFMIQTLNGTKIERVAFYKYIGTWLDLISTVF